MFSPLRRLSLSHCLVLSALGLTRFLTPQIAYCNSSPKEPKALFFVVSVARHEEGTNVCDDRKNERTHRSDVSRTTSRRRNEPAFTLFILRADQVLMTHSQEASQINSTARPVVAACEKAVIRPHAISMKARISYAETSASIEIATERNICALQGSALNP